MNKEGHLGVVKNTQVPIVKGDVIEQALLAGQTNALGGGPELPIPRSRQQLQQF